MRDIINVSVKENHFFDCPQHAIALQGEGLSHSLVIEINDKLNQYWPYLDFRKPSGEPFKTPRLTVENNKINYKLPLSLLDEKGILEVQLVLQDESGFIWKSNVKKFNIRHSINAVDGIPNKEDFITVAQNQLDRAENLLEEITQMYGESVGDVANALDHIIELQESIIGGVV